MKHIIFLITITLLFIASTNAYSRILVSDAQLCEITRGFSDSYIDYVKGNGIVQRFNIKLKNLISFISHDIHLYCQWQICEYDEGILHVYAVNSKTKQYIHIKFLFIKNGPQRITLYRVYYNRLQLYGKDVDVYMNFVIKAVNSDPSNAVITPFSFESLSLIIPERVIPEITKEYINLNIKFRKTDFQYLNTNTQLKKFISYFSQKFNLVSQWEIKDQINAILHFYGINNETKERIHYKFYVTLSDQDLKFVDINKIYYNNKEIVGTKKDSYIKFFTEAERCNQTDAKITCYHQELTGDMSDEQLSLITRGISELQVDFRQSNGISHRYNTKLKNIIVYFCDNFDLTCYWEIVNKDVYILHFFGKNNKINKKLHYKYIFIKNKDKGRIELSSIVFNNSLAFGEEKDNYMKFFNEAMNYNTSNARFLLSPKSNKFD